MVRRLIKQRVYPKILSAFFAGCIVGSSAMLFLLHHNLGMEDGNCMMGIGGSNVADKLKHFADMNKASQVQTTALKNAPTGDKVEVKTAALPQSGIIDPSKLEDWLVKNKNTPAGRFVKLLQIYLHSPTADSEALRNDGCKGRGKRNSTLCLAGMKNYIESRERLGTTKQPKEDEVFVRVDTESGGHFEMDVSRVKRFSEPSLKRYRIPSLFTWPVCLPLTLAAASVEGTGVVVELGTYVGFSSRCIGMGLNLTGLPDLMYAFDAFDNSHATYHDIKGKLPTVTDYNPNYNENSTFQFLWYLAMEDVYPSGKSFAGWITSDSLNPSVWGNRSISLISIDSVKRWGDWKEQMSGLSHNFLQKGAIISFMDFLNTAQPLLVYGCLRDKLWPVYTSYCTGEHWIFIVMENLEDVDVTVNSCMRRLLNDGSLDLPESNILTKITNQLKSDLFFLQTLDFAANPEMKYVEGLNCTQNRIEETINNPKDWKQFLKGNP